jgi:hypothetical protein
LLLTVCEPMSFGASVVCADRLTLDSMWVAPTMGILHIPCDNVSTIVPLHPTCNTIEWEIMHVNVQEFITSYPLRKEPDQSDQYTSKIPSRYIHIFYS